MLFFVIRAFEFGEQPRELMRRRTKLLAGAGVLIVIIAIAVWFATRSPVPPEPVYKGRPLSQWIDGIARGQGVSQDENNRGLNSMDSNAVPWLVWYLKKNLRGSFDQHLLRVELRLARFRNGLLVTNQLAKIMDKEVRRNSALALLSQYAPGTCFEESAARAILKSKSPLSDFDPVRIMALGAFKNEPALVLPVLCAGLTNAGMRDTSTMALSRFGWNAIPTLYQMVLAEPGSNGPVEAALLYLNGTAWKDCVEEKRRRR